MKNAMLYSGYWENLPGVLDPYKQGLVVQNEDKFLSILVSDHMSSDSARHSVFSSDMGLDAVTPIIRREKKE